MAGGFEKKAWRELRHNIEGQELERKRLRKFFKGVAKRIRPTGPEQDLISRDAKRFRLKRFFKSVEATEQAYQSNREVGWLLFVFGILIGTWPAIKSLVYLGHGMWHSWHFPTMIGATWLIGAWIALLRLIYRKMCAPRPMPIGKLNLWLACSFCVICCWALIAGL